VKHEIEHASRHATRARENALSSGEMRLKEEWLCVAEKWDDIAREYARLAKLLGHVAN
jgi:hypothetical protein